MASPCHGNNEPHVGLRDLKIKNEKKKVWYELQVSNCRAHLHDTVLMHCINLGWHLVLHHSGPV